MKYKFNVTAWCKDSGDGSHAIYLYNSLDDVRSEIESRKGELSDEEWQEILDENNSYENGSISKESIEIEIVDGIVKLVNSPSFSTD